MTDYDSYFTNNDKPMAESLNDALLLSNMFDLNVDISLPTMYNNSTWSVSSGNRKAGVAIINVKEATGLSVSTVDDDSVITGSGTLKLGFYPNFNAFGGIDKISWTGTGTITCSIHKNDGTVIVSSVTNGGSISSTPQLKTLQNFEIRLTLTSATLKTLTIEMTNKDHTRYGAKIGINDIDGLNDELTSINDDITTIEGDANYTTVTSQTYSGNYSYIIRNNMVLIDLQLELLEGRAVPIRIDTLPSELKPSKWVRGVCKLTNVDTHDIFGTIEIDSDYGNIEIYLEKESVESGVGIWGQVIYAL